MCATVWGGDYRFDVDRELGSTTRKSNGFGHLRLIVPPCHLTWTRARLPRLVPFEHAMEDTGVTLLLNTFKAGRFFSDVKKEHRGVGLG